PLVLGLSKLLVRLNPANHPSNLVKYDIFTLPPSSPTRHPTHSKNGTSTFLPYQHRGCFAEHVNHL
ncbi:hypothetical protein CHS0354_031189, partial [Potamilus streckersoni]